MLYSFKLGRNKELSIAELIAVFGSKRIEEYTQDHLLIHAAKPVTQEVFNRLGGSIKVSQVLFEKAENELVDTITEVILKNSDIDSKITYAINIEPISQGSKKLLKNLLSNIKKSLKTHKAKVRFINKLGKDGAKNIENIQSKKEILDKENCIEINLLKKGSTYLVSHLVASQDIENYSKRDYEKPKRDTVNGMLPPKLAQILINLSLNGQNSLEPQRIKDITITDPFCGSGGVIMEALLMGFHAIGSDLNPKMISDTKENINWLRTHYDIHKKQNCIAFTHDATQRFPKAKKQGIIATEGYLGEPMGRYPNEEAIHRNFSHIKKLYKDFFKNASHMYSHALIAICIPNYIQKNQVREPKDLIKQIEALGFTLLPLIPKNVNAQHHILKKGDTLQTYLYKRPDQIVGRRICVFKRNTPETSVQKKKTSHHSKSTRQGSR